MDDLKPDEARARFSPVEHGPSKTYRHFDDPEGGVWRPLFHDGHLLGYSLYQPPRKGKRVVWRPRR